MKLEAKKFALAAVLALAVGATVQAQRTDSDQSQGNITQGPMIQYADDRFAVITWTTSAPGDSRVVYGTDRNNLTQVAEGAGNTSTHRVELTSLEPGTTYYFQIDQGKATADLLSFETGASGATAVQNQQPRVVARGQTLAGGGEGQQSSTAAAMEPPKIEYASDTSAILSWRTATPSDSLVYYGTSPTQLNQRAGSRDDVTFHRVHITALQPGTTYYFQVNTPDGESEVYTVRTVARGGRPMYDQTAARYAPASEQSQTTAQSRPRDASTPEGSGRGGVIPEGTVIQATLESELSTKTAQPGQRFTATVSQPVRAEDGSLAVPVGSKITGEVTEVEQGKTLPQVRGRGRLNLHFTEIQLPDGGTVPLTATLVSVHDTKATEEGEVQSRTTGGQAAKGVGIGAAIGTVGGLIFGSALKGLLIGAIAGGGYVLATQGKDVDLKPGTGMRLRLDHAVTVPAGAGQRSGSQLRR